MFSHHCTALEEKIVVVFDFGCTLAVRCGTLIVQHGADADMQKETPSVQLGDLTASTHLQRTAHSRYYNYKEACNFVHITYT